MAQNRKKPAKISVLLDDEEFARFDTYCRERGYKKSTLIARLIRQFLDLEGYGLTNPRAPAARFGRS
jgi:metal-responsive CopG/Arc/MetJ family transcriptional regulator